MKIKDTEREIIMNYLRAIYVRICGMGGGMYEADAELVKQLAELMDIVTKDSQ